MNITERYACAVGTTTLQLDFEHSTPLDVIIASGWTRSEMGGHLRRLRAEWDCAVKPFNMTRRKRVRALRALRSWQETAALMLAWCERKCVPGYVGLSALSLWIDDTCVHCHGRGFEQIPGTPALSAIACRHCRGSGRERPPDVCARAMDMMAACTGADVMRMRRALEDIPKAEPVAS